MHACMKKSGQIQDPVDDDMEVEAPAVESAAVGAPEI